MINKTEGFTFMDNFKETQWSCLDDIKFNPKKQKSKDKTCSEYNFDHTHFGEKMQGIYG